MSFTKKLTCIVAVFAVLLSLTACDMPMKVIGSIPDPKDTVITFFDSVCAGDFAESDKHLSGISLSMKKQVEGVFSQKLYNYLLKSYCYELRGEVYSEKLDANCKVEFTSLDLNLLSGDLKSAATKLGRQYMAETKEGYVEKKGDSYTLSDEGAEKVAAEALDSLMTSSEKYCSTRTYDINLKYGNGKWLINLPEDLFSAICGGFDISD